MRLLWRIFATETILNERICSPSRSTMQMKLDCFGNACLPGLAIKGKCTIPGHKSMEERVTIMCCANATGLHKLKLCIVGKAKKPRPQVNLHSQTCQSLISAKKAWMDLSIFRQWFDKILAPSKRAFKIQRVARKRLYSCWIIHQHIQNEKLSFRSDDGQIFAKYLPPNGFLIQPLNQGVIANEEKLQSTSSPEQLGRRQ